MKSKAVTPHNVTRLALLLATAFTLHFLPATARGQGTAFTYQGMLQDGGAPATGLYDMEFRVYDAPSGGAQLGLLTTANDVPVTNGLFTVTVDAGANVFTGPARWLNIAVRPGASAGAFANLSPRQSLAPSPYAIYAAGANAAGLSGTVPSASIATNSITSAMIADGAVTSNKLASAVGQWSVSGADVYRSGGLVGIGKSPANGVALDVAGAGRFTAGLTFDDGTSGTRLSMRHDGTSQALVFRDAWIGVDRVWLKQNGNLGIGTPSPAQKLDVQGNAYVSGNVGIGTTSPDRPLTVRSVSDQWISLKDNPGTTRWHINSYGGTGFNIAQTGVADGRFFISTNGNVGIGTTVPGTILDVAGEATMTACNITSDRNAKEKFTPINAREVLDKVARLPITEWQYKTQSDARHIGPMAQDFREAFGVGRDEKHITTVDADGVALAAIQGLNEKVEEKDARIRELEKMVAELKQVVDRLAPSAR